MGLVVGEVVGLVVGLVVGDVVGEVVGLVVGDVVGDAVGEVVGLVVGAGVLQSLKSVPLKNSVKGLHLQPVMGDPMLLKQNLDTGLNPLSGLFSQIVCCSEMENPDSQKS